MIGSPDGVLVEEDGLVERGSRRDTEKNEGDGPAIHANIREKTK
jgi:hypothetical protein